MKSKLISIALIVMLSAPLIAQSTDNQKMSFAILGGINFQNLNGKNHSGDKLTNDMILGYHGGLNIQIPLVSGFYFQPGILFSTKGAKSVNGSVTSTCRLSYIEIPLNFVYNAKIGIGKIILGFGPYLAYGIGGKVETVGSDVTVTTKVAYQNIVELTDPLLTTYFKAFDAGGNIFAGYQTASGIFLQLNAQLGMVKINPENRWIQNDKASTYNTGFGISLGYRF
jgi:hypothetical protein